MTEWIAKSVDYSLFPNGLGHGPQIAKTPAGMNARTILLSLDGSIPSGLSPGVSLVTVLSSTSIRIRFLYPAFDNAALRSVANYLISPSLIVYSVTPQAITNPTYVDLVIDEQATGASYTVTLQRIVKA